MKSFIDQIVELINNCEVHEYEMCIVVPNRRAGLFLKQKLTPSGDDPRWLPTLQTIEDFVFGTGNLTEPDNVTLLGILYKAHCRNNTSPMSFDNFLSWGSEILHDFEEVDQYLANPVKLFEYVRDAREIDIWTPGESMTDFERNYLAFFRSLNDLYDNFHTTLTERNLAYQGKATRLIAEEPEKYLTNLPWKKIYFAGFNALTPAQLKIIKYLIKQNKAEIIFDADEYYLNNPNMEAGLFLRKFSSDDDLTPIKEVSSNFIRQNRNIFVCGVPGLTGQARIAGSILADIPPEKYNSTALVLADESLLLPVLNSLPYEQSNFNVTMGFPLIHTPLYSLVDSFMKLHLNAVTVGVYYHADVTAILQNSQLDNLIPSTTRNKIISSIRKNNYSYISLDEIKKQTDNQFTIYLDTIFAACADPYQVMGALIKLIEKLKSKLLQEESTSDEEILFTLWKKIHTIRDAIEKEDVEIGTMMTLYNFFREMAASTRVPFYGEPLKGVQIMGMLETRMLDFENVILLSVNEDILPSAKSNKSFIPFDIRRHYGLPTHHERQAIFAYHFYRLLQRPLNTWLIYNHDGDQLGGGEKSRFIRQLEWELPEKGVKVTTLSANDVLPPLIKKEISVAKDDFVMKKLNEKAVSGFSYSSLKQYLNCKLAFYYSYILKLEEKEEVEEDISSKTMGLILHGILEDVYSKFIDRQPDEKSLQEVLDNAEELIHSKTKSFFPALRIDTGHNLLFLKVAETWLQRFIKSEIECVSKGEAPIIKGVEMPFKRQITINHQSDQPTVINLYGKIDRVDLMGGKLRVIDYKTGKVVDKDTKLTTIEELFNSEKDQAKQLQLSFYKYLTSNEPTLNEYEILPGIITFRSLNKGFIQLEGNFPEKEFEEGLRILLEEIFDEKINFTQSGTKYCKYCNFQHICQKE